MTSAPKTGRLRRFAAAARRFARFDEGLHRCPACGRAFVCPMDWETDGEDHWRIQLYCSECDTWREVRATNAEASAFDLVLDRQVAEIAHALERIDRERMRADVEVLLAAFERDLIDASDFAA